MKVLVLGGNGATGFHIVEQLLENNVDVKTIVRNSAKLKSLGNQKNFEIITAKYIYINSDGRAPIVESTKSG